MKYTTLICLFFIAGLASLSAQQEKSEKPAVAEMTTKFRVYGNCGMCEKRIEKAAQIEGVGLADWDQETGILTVHFDPAKVKPSQIHKAVAAVGHDTDKVKASDEVYEQLHACCQYERPGAGQ
ncbi:MAG: heavy-metal-associated domain-containing protein [Lewinellaceae bacterium]|nr:heavy-metal-associated domain-containing protein [Lewinellaceae bacterium]